MRLVVIAVFFCLAAGPGLTGRVHAQPAGTLLDEAFRAAQWSAATSAGAALSQAARRAATGDGALAQALQARQILLDRIAAAEQDLSASGGTDAGGNLAAATVMAGEVAGLRNELDLLDRELGTRFPDFTRLTRPETLSVAQVQGALQPDEALIFIFSGRSDTHVWAVTPRGAAWHRAQLPRVTLTGSVRDIRQSLQQAATLRSAAALTDAPADRVPDFAAVHAMLLYSELLHPLEPYLAGVRHIYAVTDGPLSGLPLSLLITDADVARDFTDPEVLRDTGWLFRRHAISTLPSVEALSLIGRADDRVADGFLGFGDPEFAGSIAAPADGVFFRSGGADLDSLRALAPLPGTRRELRQLARLLGAGPDSLYLGARADETAVRAAPLSQAGIIAFATHGLLSGELQGLAEPALALSPPPEARPGNDGLLTASEIAAFDLNAEWVILSACNTAGSDGTPDAEGLSGLARAFLFAGARTLMVSHWPVRDDAAARLTTRTIAALETGAAPRRRAEALQLAMEDLLMDDTAPALAHPAAWAPFVLVGYGGY